MKTNTEDRILRTEQIYNVRELGGYPVQDGKRRVKWGLLYRAGELSSREPGPQDENDKKLLEERNIVTVVDFRGADEREAHPDPRLKTVRNWVNLPIGTGNMARVPVSTEDAAEAEMLKMYEILPEEALPLYRVFFEMLTDPVNTPILYHCTAGKDRTGLASALLLYALGADMALIFDDYLESFALLRERFTFFLAAKPYLAPFMMVKRIYLETALARIEQYGGLDHYIQNELGVNTRRLRELYTE